MLSALLVFLFGCLILVAVIYVTNLVMAMLDLPENIKKIAIVIFGLICLVVLMMLTMQVFNHGFEPSRWR